MDPARQPTSVAAPLSTAEHLRAATWWPTAAAGEAAGYVGSKNCARCHTEIATTQQHSQMAHTLAKPTVDTVPDEVFTRPWSPGDFTYAVARPTSGDDAAPRLVVQETTAQVAAAHDGAAQRSAELEWSFGSGEVGQSYLWRDAGNFLESRFNYFSALHGLGPTPGRLKGSPVNLDMALGRPLQGFEARTCFVCHSTALPASEPLDPHRAEPGVRCEACHGPGAQHVAAMEAADGNAVPPGQSMIVNGARMQPAAAVDMCGSCHGTSWDVRLMGATGQQTVRFPAYRLQQSRCWGVSGDARVTCTACHNPHEPLETRTAAYDSACLACHKAGSGSQPRPQPSAMAGERAAAQPLQAPFAPACRAGKTRECATCHMPRVPIAEMHYSFTDHRIRVVHQGEAFPD